MPLSLVYDWGGISFLSLLLLFLMHVSNRFFPTGVLCIMILKICTDALPFFVISLPLPAVRLLRLTLIPHLPRFDQTLRGSMPV